MFTPNAILLMLALAGTSPEPAWELAGKGSNLLVYARERAGTGIKEMKATGMIDAPPHAVWKVLRDVENYRRTMPFTEVSEVVGREANDRVVYFYTVLNAPLVSRRDYTIRIVDQSEWKDGAGYLKLAWSAAPDKGPKPKTDGTVRVTVNEGFWKLEPRDNGTQTFLTYYIYTDPGGTVPRWLVNKANTSAVPDVFGAVRKVAASVK
jgi:hypothetical protein